MNLLISTPQNNFFIAAIGEKNVADFRIVKKEYSQAELLLKTINNILSPNKLQAKKLNAIFVVEGPGAFSALRVGIATANSLAYSLNVPVFGIRMEKEWGILAPEEQMEKIWEKAVETEKPKNQKTKKLKNGRINFESGLLRFARRNTRRNNSSESGLLRFARNKFVAPFYGMEPHITRKNEKT